MRRYTAYIAVLLIITLSAFALPRFYLHQCSAEAEHHAMAHHDTDGDHLHGTCAVCDMDLPAVETSALHFAFGLPERNPVFASHQDNFRECRFIHAATTRGPPAC